MIPVEKIKAPEIPRELHHPLRLRWQVKALRLLGHMPDAKLARKMGVSLDAVQAERRRRRIEPFRPRIPNIEWTPKMIQLLGTDIDSNIATQLGFPEHSVSLKRWKMGIAPYANRRKKRNTFAWTRDKIALLGTDGDRVIARRLGVSVPTVAIKRTQVGIRSFYPQRRIRWTKGMVALLGKVTDWKIARKYKMSQESVARDRRKRGIPPCVENRPVKRTPRLKPILALPMRLIGRRYKISTETVARLRQELGVSPLGRWPDKSRRKMISPR
jgi:hypothetical protein